MVIELWTDKQISFLVCLQFYHFNCSIPSLLTDTQWSYASCMSENRWAFSIGSLQHFPPSMFNIHWEPPHTDQQTVVWSFLYRYNSCELCHMRFRLRAPNAVHVLVMIHFPFFVAARVRVHSINSTCGCCCWWCQCYRWRSSGPQCNNNTSYMAIVCI